MPETKKFGMDEDTLSKWFCVKTKEMIDDMHKRKIDMADSSYVINGGCYIGESTRSEINYAEKTGKRCIILNHYCNTGNARRGIRYEIRRSILSNSK